MTRAPLARAKAIAFTLWLVVLALVLVPGISLVLWRVREGVATRRFARACARLIVTLSGFPLKVSGTEHLSKHPCVVMVANHTSYIDSIVLLAALPNDYRFVANHAAATQPLLGTILRKGRHLIVNRGSVTSRTAAARRMITTLSGGASLMLFPEGTRANRENMRAFSSGPFRAAIRAGRPVVPVAITGTGRVLPRGAWLCRPSIVAVVVLRPISVETVAAAQLRDAAAAAIANVLESPHSRSLHPSVRKSAGFRFRL